MAKILLSNATILTMDDKGTIYDKGYLVIEDEQISEIGPQESLEALGGLEGYEVLDCTDKIVMPGMINCHSHMSMIVYRSLADDMPDRLNRFMIPLEDRTRTIEMVEDGTYYAAAEMLMGGITTVVDQGGEVEVQAKVFEDIKMRGVLSETISSRNFAETFQKSKDFLANWSNHALVTPSITCHAPYSVENEHIVASHRLAREYDVLMQMHLAEMVYEFSESKKHYGVGPVQRLDSLGVLDEKFLGAHLCLASKPDLEIVAKRQAKVSYNPGANSKAAKDIAPVVDMHLLDIPVGLGTDGPMSSNSLNLFGILGLAARLQKLRYMDRSAFPCELVVRMATIEGAKAIGLENKIGSLERGKLADVIIIETESVNMMPIYDYYATIVYSANASNVETTIVNGEIVVLNKHLISKNLQDLRKNMLLHHKTISKVAEQLYVEIEEKYDLSQKLNY
ncbi:MAG: amidohydrolase [Clostridiaceae bacterium]|nr:amidohydrolase [Clostridiaceae bacterium]